MTEKTKFFREKLKYLLEEAIDSTEFKEGDSKYIEMNFGNGIMGKMYYQEDENNEILKFHFSGYTDEDILNELKEFKK